MYEKYKSDLEDIRDMMHRSSRFISLSGYSGYAVGTIALVGAYFAYSKFYTSLPVLGYESINISSAQLKQFLIIAIATLFVAIFMAIFFTTREAKIKKQPIWDQQSKRLVINLLIPLFVGGIICLIFLNKGFIGLLAPFTLIFHGLALVNASQYSLREIRVLGVGMLILGLFGLIFTSYGLILWAIGFGVFHILYGLIMQRKN